MNEFVWYLRLVLSLAATVAAFAASLWFWRAAEGKPFLDRKRKQMTLKEKTQISHDTWRFVFSLEKQRQPLGLPIGYHLRLFAPNPKGAVPGEWNGKEDPEAAAAEISRKYTPISSATTRGYVSLLIKIYSKQNKPPFIDGGKMSQYLSSLKPGDKVDVEGPFGRIRYLGMNNFSLLGREVKKEKIGLIGGGSGITPLFQLLLNFLNERRNNMQIHLIYANKTEQDILLRQELEEMRDRFKGRLFIWFVVETSSAAWQYSTGFITKEIIKNNLPPPAADSLILCCGPQQMLQHACLPNLQQLGYKQEDVFCF